MKRVLLFLASVTLLFGLEEEDLIWKEGPSVQEYNSALQRALMAQDWWSVIDYASLISYNFPSSDFAQEAAYMIAEAYYHLDQLEYANEALSAYLKEGVSLKHFEDAIEHKFKIACRFSQGEKKHLFGSPKMPAWVPAKEDSIEIFDEVIAALPHSEFAIKSMLEKAKIQSYMEDYKLSLETLDLLIRKFPKHELAAEGFLEKEKVFLLQCQAKNLDPDILDMAEMNLRKFRLAFPREERLKEAEKIFLQMQEIFAQSLYEIGYFFEKTKKVPASLIYYNKVATKYPKTEAATEALKKMDLLADRS